MYQVGYWTDLDSIKLEDTGDTMVSTFQAMPYGKYEHPVYGEIDFNQEKAAMAAQGVNSRVRGTDLDIDYDHKQYGGEAAGWVKSAEARTDGLWLTVEWTKRAWQLIKDKAYRYFSPEFADEWTHPKTKVTHKNVLFGGGITNRPFLKDILPLNMSELFTELQGTQEGTGMDPKKLRKLLGLPEDATDEQVNTKLGELPDDAVIQAPTPDDKDKGGSSDQNNKDDKAGDQGTGGGQQIAASEVLPPEVIKLAESNPAVKALTDTIVALHDTVQKQGAALQLAETAVTVKRLAEPVDGRQLPPSAQEALQAALLSPSAENVIKFAEALNKTGYVQLGEQGKSGDHGDADGEAATKKFNDAVEAAIKASDGKLNYGDAVEQVASKNPDLFEGYRQSSYSFREQ